MVLYKNNYRFGVKIIIDISYVDVFIINLNISCIYTHNRQFLRFIVLLSCQQKGRGRHTVAHTHTHTQANTHTNTHSHTHRYTLAHTQSHA